MVELLAPAFTYDAHGAIALEVGGVLIPDIPDVITPAIREAMLAGRFEAAEARQIPAIVDPGDRVVEIGAGIGFISTLLSRVPGVASVLAVEANPNLIAYMERLHALNGADRVRRMNAVLDNEPAPGEATFYLRQDFWMGSLMAGPNPYVDSVRVPTRNFSALLREERATLVVCDIEGAETCLFDGADLGEVTRVFLEVHDHVTGLTGVGAVFAALAARGFVYDPLHSAGSVVLFRRPATPDIPRPYRG